MYGRTLIRIGNVLRSSRVEKNGLFVRIFSVFVIKPHCLPVTSEIFAALLKTLLLRCDSEKDKEGLSCTMSPGRDVPHGGDPTAAACTIGSSSAALPPGRSTRT